MKVGAHWNIEYDLLQSHILDLRNQTELIGKRYQPKAIKLEALGENREDLGRILALRKIKKTRRSQVFTVRTISDFQ